MRFCIASRTTRPASLAETLDLAARLGYDGVEIWSADLGRTGERPVALRQQADQLGLTLLVHAYNRDVNLAAPDSDHRTVSVALTRRSLQDAVELGALLCVVRPGKLEDRDDDPDSFWPAMIESFTSLTDTASVLGLRVGVVNMEPGRGYLICTLADLARLRAAVPPSGLVLDLANAVRTCAYENRSLDCLLESIGEPLHVHLSDSSVRKRHLPLGEGLLDLSGLIDALRRRCYDGTIAIEGRARGRELATVEANRRYIRRFLTGAPLHFPTPRSAQPGRLARISLGSGPLQQRELVTLLRPSRPL